MACDVNGTLVSAHLSECSSHLTSGERNAVMHASDAFLLVFDTCSLRSFEAARDTIQIVTMFKEGLPFVAHLVGITGIDATSQRTVSTHDCTSLAIQHALPYAEIDWRDEEDFVSVRTNILQLALWMHSGKLLSDTHEQLRQCMLAQIEKEQLDREPIYSIPIDTSSTKMRGTLHDALHS